jgi:pimeloyl-ACP methyl ester carboxylesterase
MKKMLASEISFCLLFFMCSCKNSNTGTSTQNESNTIPEVKAIFINGDSLHYIEMGKGDPVVFVHGTLGDYRTWEAQMDTFAKSHRVISYSRRFAYPNRQVINDSADYSVIPHAKDLAEFIKLLNLGKVHLVGHSYGGYTALLTTIDHPELVRSLTLGEPPVVSLLNNVPGGDTMMNNFGLRAFVPALEAFKNNNKERAEQVFLGGVMGDSLYYLKLSQKDRDIMMDNWLELRGFVFNKLANPPITCDQLTKIKTPVLLLKGDRSPLILTSITNEIDHCLVYREDAIIPQSSHGMEYENPIEFNKIVLGFINRN